jgi:hypothetical protein
MRVSPDHLLGISACHIIEAEATNLLGHAGMKYDLKQEVPEFITKIAHVPTLDRIRNFVSLLNGVRGDAAKVLLDIPRATIFRVTELAHNFK